MPSSLTLLTSRHLAVVADWSDADLPSLRDALSALADPRSRRGVRYAFLELLLAATAAVLSGSRSLTMIAEWAADAHHRNLITAWTRPTSLSTLHRILAGADAVAFDTAISGWITARAHRTAGSAAPLPAIAVDGKEVRGAKHAGGTRTFLMAAFDHGTGTVIGQESVAEKTNEIPHLPVLLDRIGPLHGHVITADALHTLPQQADAIISRGGHYLFTVKHNAKALHREISATSWSRHQPQHACTEKGHGRTSSWQTTVLPAPTRIRFPHVAQIIRIQRGRHQHDTDDTTGEIVYAITSLSPGHATPAQLAALLRGHWGIENRLHWVRDTGYAEDASQVRAGTAAHLMASLRNLAISIHRLAGHTNLAAATRHYARNPHHAIQLTGL